MLEWRENLRRRTHFFSRPVDQLEICYAHFVACNLQPRPDHFFDKSRRFFRTPVSNQFSNPLIKWWTDARTSSVCSPLHPIVCSFRGCLHANRIFGQTETKSSRISRIWRIGSE